MQQKSDLRSSLSLAPGLMAFDENVSGEKAFMVDAIFQHCFLPLFNKRDIHDWLK